MDPLAVEINGENNLHQSEMIEHLPESRQNLTFLPNREHEVVRF